MNAVLDEDGLDLGLQLSGPAQHSHSVAVWILRGTLPGVDAHHHSVILEETKAPDSSAVPGSPRSLRAGGAADLQSVGLLSADANLWDAAIPGNRQDVLGVPALGLRPIPGRKRNHVIPPVPLQDPHNAACGITTRYSTRAHVKFVCSCLTVV